MASADYTLRAWDITDHDHPVPAVATITGDTGEVVSLKISPDGKTLVTSSHDETIRTRNVLARQQ